MEAAESRQPTIFDVAAEAGVSKSMVSRVMRGEGGVRQEKVDRVLAAAEERHGQRARLEAHENAGSGGQEREAAFLWVSSGRHAKAGA